MVLNFYMQGKNAVLISVLSLFFAWVFPCINQLFRPQIDYTDSIGRFHFYIGLLLPFAGFFIYWIYIQILSKRAKDFIRERFSPSMRKFQGLHDRRNEIDTIMKERPKKVQTLCFSATMDSAVKKLAVQISVFFFIITLPSDSILQFPP